MSYSGAYKQQHSGYISSPSQHEKQSFSNTEQEDKKKRFFVIIYIIVVVVLVLGIAIFFIIRFYSNGGKVKESKKETNVNRPSFSSSKSKTEVVKLEPSDDKLVLEKDKTKEEKLDQKFKSSPPSDLPSTPPEDEAMFIPAPFETDPPQAPPLETKPSEKLKDPLPNKIRAPPANFKLNTSIATLKGDLKDHPVTHFDKLWDDPTTVKLSDYFALAPHDITLLQGCVIVNAANVVCLGGGGIDKAIHASADQTTYSDSNPAFDRTWVISRVKKECCNVTGVSDTDTLADFITKNYITLEGSTGNRIETGGALVTSPLYCPADAIIHTAGPNCSSMELKNVSEREDARNKLTDAYYNSLRLAEEIEAERVALPLISIGIYCYPKKTHAEDTFKAIEKYFNERGKVTSIKKVMLIAFGKDTASKYLSKSKFLSEKAAEYKKAQS